MITLGREGSVVDEVASMLLAQEGSSEEERPMMNKIEENVIEKINSKDTHVRLLSFLG